MAYVEDNAVIGKELSDTYFNKGTEEEGKITPKPATTAQKGVVEQATPAEVGAGDSDTLAVNPLGLVGALNDTSTAGGNAVQKGVANALEASISGDQGAQTALGNALKEEVSTAISQDAASMKKISDALPAATDDQKGVSALNQGNNLPADATNNTDSLTAAGVTNILNGTAANPLKTAVLAQVPLATTTVAGLIEEATGEETRLGATDANKDDRAVTPGSMSYALQGRREYQLDLASAGANRVARFDGRGSTASETLIVWGTPNPTLAYVTYSILSGGSATATGVGAASAIHGSVASSVDTVSNSAGGFFSNGSSTGAGTKYGVVGDSRGTGGGTNIGVYGTASFGATNWAGYFAGNVFYSGSLTSSDERLKDSFADAPDLSAVKIESFDKYSVSKDEKGKEVRTKIGRFTGVRAQAVKAVAPEMVSEAGDYLAVQESSILFAMIDGLRKELAALKAAK